MCLNDFLSFYTKKVRFIVSYIFLIFRLKSWKIILIWQVDWLRKTYLHLSLQGIQLVHNDEYTIFLSENRRRLACIFLLRTRDLGSSLITRNIEKSLDLHSLFAQGKTKLQLSWMDLIKGCLIAGINWTLMFISRLSNTKEEEIQIGIGEVKKIARLRSLDILDKYTAQTK